MPTPNTPTAPRRWSGSPWKHGCWPAPASCTPSTPRAGPRQRWTRPRPSTWPAGDGVVEHAYLTFRRVARGRAEPPELLARAAEVLRADATALTGGGPAAEPGGGAATGDGELRPTVRAVVASVLALDEHLVPDTELTGLAEFSSLRMVEIVEGLEAAFDVEFGPDDLVPEKLHRIDDLCGLVHRALADR
ncbi:conserved hypothetical protein [Streptomyces himastatinicus ATCC 53653]|uniref:Carrier domain-containing protein n=1 Tax=Streptomyces himastatinicus ATCC 53653 TaxID=457427 RepID=D9WEH0_9ACTN|nr:conserved hypothetical protein [Streptomyces himastatinicus ATCC 53653]